MQKPGPDAKAVAVQARAASATLAAMIKEVESGKPLDTARVRGLLASYVADGLKPAPGKVLIGEKERPKVRIDEMDWDEAAQLYLSMAALSQALEDFGAKQPPLIRGDMLDIKDRLKQAFPKGYDSPEAYDPLEKPSRKIPSLADRLNSIRSQLGN